MMVMLRPKITYFIFEISHSFEFDTAISLNAKTSSVPQFIGASPYIFETIDLGIKFSNPLALYGWKNPSDTLVLVVEVLHRLQLFGRSFEGHNLELMRAINKNLNAT